MMSLLLLACFDPHGGTAVGNPATAGFTGIEIPQDVLLDMAEVDVKYLVLQDCQGSAVAVPVAETIDLLRDATYNVDLGGGRWCSMSMAVGEEGLRLAGETVEGTPFDVVMSPARTIPVGGRFQAKGQNVLVAVVFDEMVDGAELDAIGGFVRQFPGDPLAEAWSERLPGSVLLVEDIDRDGFPDQDDPTLFDPWADDDKPEYQLDSASGCNSGALGAGGVALFAGLVLLMSRRR